MEAADAVLLTRQALMLILTIAGPMLLAALIVGVVIGLIQALTQVQEMTLTFVPKLVAMGAVLLLSLPMIGDALDQFTHTLGDRIAVHGGGVAAR